MNPTPPYRSGCLLLLVYLLVVVVAIALLASCRTRTVYLPMETVRTDSIHVRDTTFLWRLVPYRDSVSVRDTASFLSNPYAYSYAGYSGGVLHHSLGIWTWATVRVQVPYFIDRYVRIELPKPYPVEKELTRWQRFRMDFGEFSLGAVPLLVGVVVLLARRRKSN